MSGKPEQLLIVVSVLEGRHFPRLPRVSLTVTSSFDGEQLSTDPVDHVETPQFNTELAWELDRRALHRHRLQRTPIKLQCWSLDPASRRRESVGYIVLDLRSVQEKRQEPRWFPLLSSPYPQQKPALLLGTALEKDQVCRNSPEKFRARRAPPRQGSPSVPELLPENLQAVLVSDLGHHQVGPPDRCSDMFLLSVTVAFASKLEQLVPDRAGLSSEDRGFFFYYCLLGNDITSQPFLSLLSPDFQPERASVRIRSSRDVLQNFLVQQPDLEIHLCCGNQSLGGASVSLSALASVSVDLGRGAATVEGVFPLTPPRRANLAPLAAELQPSVGVAVTLRREDVAPQPPAGNRDVTTEAPPPEAPPPETPPPEAPPPQAPPTDHPSPAPLRKGRPPSQTESEADSLLEELQDREPDRVAAATPEGAEPQDGGGGASSLSVSAPKVSIPSSSHHYSFSLDLQRLGKLSLTHGINATLRYQYRFFGSSAPIMTNPPVQLQRNQDVSLPQSFCAFDFAAEPKQLTDTFLREPLVVELWHRGAASRDQLIGRASLQLSQLLVLDRTRFTGPAGGAGWRQSHRNRVPVVPVQSPAETVAELSYVATLEDHGFIRDRRVQVSDSDQNEVPTQPLAPPAGTRPGALPGGPPAETRPGAPPGGPPAAQAPRDTMEYRTALELELWKEQQEDLFDDQLKRKELRHMQALAEEWRRRDGEREALVNKKETEFQRLELQLQKTLLDLETREKQLEEAELQTRRLQRDLRAEHELAQKELQETGRRLQRENDHRVALERETVRLMEEERGRLLQQMSDGESRYKQLEREFQMFREQQGGRPEVRLQADINLLTLEKVELERKLESTTKSKLHYKQQWGRALKELARFKQREQENAVIRLKKQQAELEAMRLRYLATQEKEAVQQDRRELDGIRDQINRLKKQEDKVDPAPSSTGPAPSGPGPAPSLHGPAPSLPGPAPSEDHLCRLLEERETLLRTGVYDHQDRIIVELDRQVREAMGGMGGLADSMGTSFDKTKKQYNLFTYNCQHFATEMRYGKPESQQVKDVTAAAGVAGGAVVGAGVGAVHPQAEVCSDHTKQPQLKEDEGDF
ncbi:centrosomal protein of 120 kDa-like [Cololabis saira]|uniref:centrosomal protein of 120 kDa-like n=1 Tax=Cololabis saira TaxID=129043 RepID=UPI002AD1F8BB|nr:centrosomal protein of 120 kDa-like [Cololabis saira]